MFVIITVRDTNLSRGLTVPNSSIEGLGVLLVVIEVLLAVVRLGNFILDSIFSPRFFSFFIDIFCCFSLVDGIADDVSLLRHLKRVRTLARKVEMK